MEAHAEEERQHLKASWAYNAKIALEADRRYGRSTADRCRGPDRHSLVLTKAYLGLSPAEEVLLKKSACHFSRAIAIK